jgi:hypothetical protein
MCAGDMTVEWPRTEADGRHFAFDGWGVAHECKSWVCPPAVAVMYSCDANAYVQDAIMKFMNDNDVSGKILGTSSHDRVRRW